jgi:hypothetical protein
MGEGLVEYIFAHHSSPSPPHPHYHCPFTPVEPGYGVDLFEDDFQFLPAADLRMDPALRPVQSLRLHSLTSVILHNSTSRLNDGIFTVYQFSVATSARFHKSECVFQFYVYGGIFLSARGTSLGTLSAYGFWIGIGTTGLLPASVFGLLIVRDIRRLLFYKTS